MGIKLKNLYVGGMGAVPKVPLFEEEDLADFKQFVRHGECVVAVDMSLFAHINVLVPENAFRLIFRTLIRMGATRILAVYDSMEENPRKAACHKEREIHRQQVAQKAQDEEKKVFPRPTQETYDIIAAVCREFEVLQCTAEVGFEAEHVIAYLARIGIVQVPLSNDTDLFLFGSPCRVSLVKKVYRVCWTSSMLDKLRPYIPSMDIFELQKSIIRLSDTDFSKKIPRESVKTLVATYTSRQLDASQQDMLEYVSTPLDHSSIKITSSAEPSRSWQLVPIPSETDTTLWTLSEGAEI